MQTRRISWLLMASAVLVLSSGLGCVERIAKIQTQPPGALVIVNDEEVGVSPVKFAFLWYGDYDIILRKPGYQTLKTHYKLNAPWYQWPPIDVVADAMVPVMIRDEQVIPAFALEADEAPNVESVVERAVELRDRALFEGK